MNHTDIKIGSHEYRITHLKEGKLYGVQSALRKLKFQIMRSEKPANVFRYQTMWSKADFDFEMMAELVMKISNN